MNVHVLCLCCSGIALGLTPVGPLLTDPQAASAFIAAHAQPGLPSWELSLLLGIAGTFWGTLVLLAETTLALSALVLASSLFGSSSSSRRQQQQQQEEQQQQERGGGYGQTGGQTGSTGWEGSSSTAGRVEVVGADGSTLMAAGESGVGLEEEAEVGSSSAVNLIRRSAETADDASETVLDQLRPRGAWEWRMLIAVSTVRFILMPVVCSGLVLGAAWLGVLPASRACLFALLLQGVMPPAQELVLMLQLQPKTVKLASSAARLLLQLYFVAVVPVTLWVSAFASWTLAWPTVPFLPSIVF